MTLAFDKEYNRVHGYVRHVSLTKPATLSCPLPVEYEENPINIYRGFEALLFGDPTVSISREYACVKGNEDVFGTIVQPGDVFDLICGDPYVLPKVEFAGTMVYAGYKLVCFRQQHTDALFCVTQGHKVPGLCGPRVQRLDYVRGELKV